MSDHRAKVLGLVERGEFTGIPSGFWLHFPAEAQHGDEAVKAHLHFMRGAQTDIFKIMNENIFHSDHVIETPADIRHFRGFGRGDGIFRAQAELTRRLCDAAGGEYPMLNTMHGLLVSATHEMNLKGGFIKNGVKLAEFCRAQPAAMRAVFDMIADSLMEQTDVMLEAGSDGIFYAALGGERHFFTDEEFAEFVLPVEKRIYDYIASKTRFNVLHICKTNVNFERYASITPAVVNWGVHTNGFSLTQGAALFPHSILLGGYADRTGELLGTDEDVRAKFSSIMEEVTALEGWQHRFILGADCTLPTGQELGRVALAASLARGYK